MLEREILEYTYPFALESLKTDISWICSFCMWIIQFLVYFPFCVCSVITCVFLTTHITSIIFEPTVVLLHLAKIVTMGARPGFCFSKVILLRGY